MAEAVRCPVCGARAFVRKAAPDGCFMGWSVGCPRYSVNDGVHRICNQFTHEKRGYSMHGFTTKEGAVKAWNRRCKTCRKYINFSVVTSR